MPQSDSKGEKTIMVWTNARIVYDKDWNDILNASTYDLEDANISLMTKRVQ